MLCLLFMSKSQNQTFSRRVHSYESVSWSFWDILQTKRHIYLPFQRLIMKKTIFFLSPRQLLKVKNQEAWWPFYSQISLARRSTWALVKDRFLRSTISLWMSTCPLDISSNSGLFTRLEVPTEKNLTLLCFSWSVSSFVYSNPRVLNPSVMATTALFTSARRTVSLLKKR